MLHMESYVATERQRIERITTDRAHLHHVEWCNLQAGDRRTHRHAVGLWAGARLVAVGQALQRWAAGNPLAAGQSEQASEDRWGEAA